MPSPEQVEDAKARLGQQASKDVDFIWKSILPAGDDEAAREFLANSGATYTNEVGKPQAMFTTERGQFFAPAQNMQDIDRDFIGQYVRPAVSRPLGEGVAEESKKYADLIGGAIKDDPWGVGKNVAVGLAGSIKDAVRHPIDTGIAFKDGVVAGAQNIGEGLAAGFDDSSKRQMVSIYGQDVSGVMKTVAALQTGAAISGAIGAGKLAAAGATVAGKAVKVTAEEAVQVTKQVARKIGGSVDDSAAYAKWWEDLAKPGTLTNREVRAWYMEAEKDIPNLIDRTAPLEKQDQQAFDMRNDVRTRARELMSDREGAAKLNVDDPNKTWPAIKDKYSSQGYGGDDLWRKIIESSQKSRASVNDSLGL